MGLRSNEPESFNDTTVVEPQGNGAESAPNPQGPESFEDGEVVIPEGFNDDGTKKEEDIPKNNQTQQLDTKEEDLKEEEEKDDENKDDEKKEEDSKEDKKEEAKEDEEKEDEKPKGKTLRVKDGEKSVDISEDATVKVKVKGKNQFVPLSELKKNYSGHVAYEEKFKGLEEKNVEIEERSQKVQAERNEVVSHLQHIGGLLDKATEKGGDPLEALYYLVDLSGRDVLNFNKVVMEGLSKEALALSEMDEVEQQLYWKNKEVEAIRSNQAAKDAKSAKEKTQRDFSSKVENLRNAQGVTEKQYVESHRELSELGYENDKLSPEVIVNYAVMKPHYENAENLCSQFEEDLGDDDMSKLVSTVADTLRKYPKINQDKALRTSLDLLGWEYSNDDDDVRKVNEKLDSQDDAGLSRDSKSHVQSDSSNQNAPESFDDFNNYGQGGQGY